MAEMTQSRYFQIERGLSMVKAVRVGIAGLVEPVPAPPLAVGGRGQHAIDEPFVRAGSRVATEGFDFVGTRRQSAEVETEPANQRRAVGLGRGGQMLGRKAGADEGVDRVDQRLAARDAGDARPADRLEGPMSFRSRERTIGRPFGPFVDPPLDEGDFLLGQPRRLGRHRRQVALSRDRLKQEALGGLARHKRGPAIAPLVDERKPIQPQPRLRLARPVALDAMLSKQRLDLRGKVDGVIGGKERRRPEHGQNARAEENPRTRQLHRSHPSSGRTHQ